MAGDVYRSMCMDGFSFSNGGMVTPSSRDYHTVCSGSPTVHGNEGALRRLEALAAGRFTRQTIILDVTVLPEIKTV